jgi:putative mRNA 3-end processing factor
MQLPTSPLLAWTVKGLYCAAGDFYIDPHRAVELAIITHAHSDHARRGHGKYICVDGGVELLKTRLGQKILVEPRRYGEEFQLGEVTVSLHSAGHILGSAQVRLQRGHEVWVASGDYKREHDPSCEPFETVPCDTFITEATFGTPKFVWQKNLPHGKLISDWWRENADRGINSLLFGYSLGKAQRILAELTDFAQRPVLIHSSISQLTECYRQQGKSLAPTRELNEALAQLASGGSLQGELILAPPSITKDALIARLGNYQTAFASGWMQGGNGYRQHDKGFVMSDHADWEDLNRTILETGARQVFVQHRNGALIQHLRKKGIDAHPVEKLSPENYQGLGGYNLRLL